MSPATKAGRPRPVPDVGRKLRDLRKARNLTQSDLAARIGIQQSDLCRMENGEYKVSLDTLIKILGVFGMDIGEFFRDEFPPPKPTDQDRELLRLFHRLDESSRTEILDFVRYKALRRRENPE